MNLEVLKKKSGVSLVEVVLYLALFALFFFSVLRFSLYVSEYNKSASERVAIDQAELFFAGHLKQSFKEASSLNVANSVLSDNNGKLRLNLPNTTYYEYSLNGARAQFSNNGTTTDFLIPSTIGISQFRFDTILNQDGTQNLGVKVRIVFYDITKPRIKSTLETSYIF